MRPHFSERFKTQDKNRLYLEIDNRNLIESDLRNIILLRFKTLDEISKNLIFDKFLQFNSDIDINLIDQRIVGAIKSAVKGYIWSFRKIEGNYKISIGFFNTKEVFYTIIFHEIGHSVLRSSGIINKDYNDSPYLEENFCWELSSIFCKIFNINYCKEREEISISFLKLMDQYGKQDEFCKEFQKLVILERKLFCFSDYGEDTFHWDDKGIPVPNSSTQYHF
jgi:hypothetical protein